jgi:hypothetical protein
VWGRENSVPAFWGRFGAQGAPPGGAAAGRIAIASVDTDWAGSSWSDGSADPLDHAAAVPALQMDDSEEEPNDARPRGGGDHHRQDGSKAPCCARIRSANEFENLGEHKDWPSRTGPTGLDSAVTAVLTGTTVAFGRL